MKIYKLLKISILLSNTPILNAAVGFDFTGKASTFDGEISVIVSLTDTTASTDMTVASTGSGNLNSNAGSFGVDSTLSGEIAANVDFLGEEITLTFDKNIIFNFIDFNEVGNDISDGVSFTIGGDTTDLFAGVTGFNGNDLYTPTSPISLNSGDSIIITGSSATSSFYIQNINITVVPEPSTYALLSGIFCLTYIILKRRR